jgi:hypothetical protein
VNVATEKKEHYLFGGKGNEYMEFLACFHVQQKEKWGYKFTKMSESGDQIFMKFDVKVMLYKTSQRHMF